MNLSTVLAFLTVAAIGAGAYRLGSFEIDIPSDNDIRHASRDFKSAVDDVMSGQFAKDLVNPPSEDELRWRQFNKGVQNTVDDMGYAVGNFLRGAGNTVRKYATGSASSRWTGYNGIAALIGTWVAVLVVM